MQEVPETELPARLPRRAKQSDNAPAQDAESKVISAQVRALQEVEVAALLVEGEKGEKKIKLIKGMGATRQESDSTSAQDERTPVIGS